MKDEYDFSGGERGKFYRPGAGMKMPVYLDEEVLTYLSERAAAKGISLSDLVNDILKRGIDLIETVKE